MLLVRHGESAYGPQPRASSHLNGASLEGSVIEAGAPMAEGKGSSSVPERGRKAALQASSSLREGSSKTGKKPGKKGSQLGLGDGEGGAAWGAWLGRSASTDAYSGAAGSRFRSKSGTPTGSRRSAAAPAASQKGKAGSGAAQSAEQDAGAEEEAPPSSPVVLILDFWRNTILSVEDGALSAEDVCRPKEILGRNLTALATDLHQSTWGTKVAALAVGKAKQELIVNFPEDPALGIYRGGAARLEMTLMRKAGQDRRIHGELHPLYVEPKPAVAASRRTPEAGAQPKQRRQQKQPVLEEGGHDLLIDASQSGGTKLKAMKRSPRRTINEDQVKAAADREAQEDEGTGEGDMATWLSGYTDGQLMQKTNKGESTEAPAPLASPSDNAASGAPLSTFPKAKTAPNPTSDSMHLHLSPRSIAQPQHQGSDTLLWTPQTPQHASGLPGAHQMSPGTSWLATSQASPGSVLAPVFVTASSTPATNSLASPPVLVPHHMRAGYQPPRGVPSGSPLQGSRDQRSTVARQWALANMPPMFQPVPQSHLILRRLDASSGATLQKSRSFSIQPSALQSGHAPAGHAIGVPQGSGAACRVPLAEQETATPGRLATQTNLELQHRDQVLESKPIGVSAAHHEATPGSGRVSGQNDRKMERGRGVREAWEKAMMELPGAAAARQGTPAAHQGTPAAHQGTPAAHQGASGMHQGEPAARSAAEPQGRPAAHQEAGKGGGRVQEPFKKSKTWTRDSVSQMAPSIAYHTLMAPLPAAEKASLALTVQSWPAGAPRGLPMEPGHNTGLMPAGATPQRTLFGSSIQSLDSSQGPQALSGVPSLGQGSASWGATYGAPLLGVPVGAAWGTVPAASEVVPGAGEAGGVHVAGWTLLGGRGIQLPHSKSMSSMEGVSDGQGAQLGLLGLSGTAVGGFGGPLEGFENQGFLRQLAPMQSAAWPQSGALEERRALQTEEPPEASPWSIDGCNGPADVLVVEPGTSGESEPEEAIMAEALALEDPACLPSVRSEEPKREPQNVGHSVNNKGALGPLGVMLAQGGNCSRGSSYGAVLDTRTGSSASTENDAILCAVSTNRGRVGSGPDGEAGRGAIKCDPNAATDAGDLNSVAPSVDAAGVSGVERPSKQGEDWDTADRGAAQGRGRGSVSGTRGALAGYEMSRFSTEELQNALTVLQSALDDRELLHAVEAALGKRVGSLGAPQGPAAGEATEGAPLNERAGPSSAEVDCGQGSDLGASCWGAVRGDEAIWEAAGEADGLDWEEEAEEEMVDWVEGLNDKEERTNEAGKDEAYHAEFHARRARTLSWVETLDIDDLLLSAEEEASKKLLQEGQVETAQAGPSERRASIGREGVLSGTENSARHAEGWGAEGQASNGDDRAGSIMEEVKGKMPAGCEPQGSDKGENDVGFSGSILWNGSDIVRTEHRRSRTLSWIEELDVLELNDAQGALAGPRQRTPGTPKAKKSLRLSKSGRKELASIAGKGEGPSCAVPEKKGAKQERGWLGKGLWSALNQRPRTSGASQGGAGRPGTGRKKQRSLSSRGAGVQEKGAKPSISTLRSLSAHSRRRAAGSFEALALDSDVLAAAGLGEASGEASALAIPAEAPWVSGRRHTDSGEGKRGRGNVATGGALKRQGSENAEACTPLRRSWTSHSERSLRAQQQQEDGLGRLAMRVYSQRSMPRKSWWMG